MSVNFADVMMRTKQIRQKERDHHVDESWLNCLEALRIDARAARPPAELGKCSCLSVVRAKKSMRGRKPKKKCGESKVATVDRDPYALAS